MLFVKKCNLVRGMRKLLICVFSLILATSFIFSFACSNEVEFTVTFEGNGGVLVSGEEVQTVKEAIDLAPPIYSKEGYSFDGWDVELAKVKEDTVAKAKWKAKTYKVTFNLNDSPESPAQMEETIIGFEYDSVMNVPSPTRFGYVFAGWFIDGEENVMLVNGQVLTTSKDFSVTATWVIDDGQVYTISYDLDGGFYKNNATNPTYYKYTDSDITIKNPIKIGHKFVGWQVQNSLDEPNDNVVIASGSMGNKSYKAVWEAKVYVIEFDQTNVTINGERFVVIDANTSLGELLPKFSQITVKNNEYGELAFYYWEVEIAGKNTKVTKDFVFYTDVFGNDTTSITIKAFLGPKWSDIH